MTHHEGAWPGEDELPSWKALSSTPIAGVRQATGRRQAKPSVQPEQHDPQSDRSTNHQSPPIAALLIAGAALLLGTTIGGILVFRGGDPGDLTALGTNPELSALQPAGLTETTNSPTSPTQLAFDDAEIDDGAEGIEPGIEAEPAEPVRRAVFSRGVIYLRGRVPSAEIGDAIFERAAAVMGPDNVVNEYIIDPSVTFDPNVGAPLYVQDLVLFRSGSAEIDSQFIPLLDLGIMLMNQNPQVTVTVIGHTDAKGNDFDNLALSQERVQAVLNYWTRVGIDPDRVTIIGKGEAEPIGDNATEDGRQFNRRVEFVITGILAG